MNPAPPIRTTVQDRAATSRLFASSRRSAEAFWPRAAIHAQSDLRQSPPHRARVPPTPPFPKFQSPTPEPSSAMIVDTIRRIYEDDHGHVRLAQPAHASAVRMHVDA